MFYLNLIVLSLIILSSFVFTKNSSYDFMKFTGYLVFYYILIVLGGILGHLVNKKYGKMVGSIAGFVVSVLLWNKYGELSKK